jgi:hypothetical protein
LNEYIVGERKQKFVTRNLQKISFYDLLSPSSIKKDKSFSVHEVYMGVHKLGANDISRVFRLANVSRCFNHKNK